MKIKKVKLLDKIKIKLPYELLIYDIETSLLPAFIFRPGEQRVNHSQLSATATHTEIICIAAKWYGKSEVMVFDGPNCVRDFDLVARKADVCLGKNSDSFDVRHINTNRLMQGLDPYPEWIDSQEDIEKRIRKYFLFPSFSLDFISKAFGNGGKDKMEFNDWKDIANLSLWNKLEKAIDCSGISTKARQQVKDQQSLTLFGKSARIITELGNKKLRKMIEYNIGDVLDTEAILVKVLPYITLRNSAANLGAKKDTGCVTCGSKQIIKQKTIRKGCETYVQWHCTAHNGYAGKCTQRWNKQNNAIYGKMKP